MFRKGIAPMSIEPLHIDYAPEDARPLLEKAKQKYGFVPNILGVMAHAPPCSRRT